MADVSKARHHCKRPLPTFFNFLGRQSQVLHAALHRSVPQSLLNDDDVRTTLSQHDPSGMLENMDVALLCRYPGELRILLEPAPDRKAVAEIEEPIIRPQVFDPLTNNGKFIQERIRSR